MDLQAIKDVKEANQRLLDDLKLGMDARAAYDDALVKQNVANGVLAEARERAKKIVYEASQRASEIIANAKALNG